MSTYDDWRARGPHENGPSCAERRCGIGGCKESGAWDAPRSVGQHPLALCEMHADLWLTGERDFKAELEEMAGRWTKPRPGTARALGERYGARRRALRSM